MGEESPRIVVGRHDIGNTLAAFEELYELVLPSHDGAADRDDAQTIVDVREGTTPGDAGPRRRAGQGGTKTEPRRV